MNSFSLYPFKTQETQSQRGIPWNIKQVNAASLWPRSQGDGVVVAVVDSGLDLKHPEIAGRVVSPRNFTAVGNSSDLHDEIGHGTHVAGIVAGKNCGVAPEARIMPLKVFGDREVDKNILEAFKFILQYNQHAAEKDRVLVVNCSFGSPLYNPLMAYYIRTLTNSGVAVVVAAGNEGDGKPDTQEIFSYPAYIYEVITTGATNQNGQAAGYSNSFDGIDLAAPGTDIYSAWPGGGYKLLSGTSMAAPHVSGAYALLAALFRKREGRWPSTDEGENILFRHIRQVPIDPLLVGRGMLDLSWERSRWPLYRVELGAFYRWEGAEEMARRARENGFNVNITKCGMTRGRGC